MLYDIFRKLANELEHHIVRGELAEAIEKIVRVRGELVRKEANLRATLDEKSEKFEQQKKEIDEFFEILNQDWGRYMKDVRETEELIDDLRRFSEACERVIKYFKPSDLPEA